MQSTHPSLVDQRKNLITPNKSSEKRCPQPPDDGEIRTEKENTRFFPGVCPVLSGDWIETETPSFFLFY